MASGDRHGQSRKKAAEKAPEQDQEEEVEAVEQEAEQSRDAAQDAFGNQGVAAMLGMPTVTPGSAGMSVEPEERVEERDVQYGGDDDAPAEGPLTVDDLVRSWNPTTKRGQDAPLAFLEPVSDLPEEDAELLAAIRSDARRPDLPAHEGLDALLQLSVMAVTTDPGSCAREAARWSTGSLVHRTWARLVAPPAPALQDPHGRLVHSRIRTAALSSLLVLDGGLPRDTAAAVLPSFCLELAGRWTVPDRVLAAVRAAENKLPVAQDVLQGLLGSRRPGEVAPRPLPPAASAHLRATLLDLLRPPDPASLLSSGDDAPAPDEDDDPLGLDAVVASLTGGRVDPMAGTWDGLLQTAERLAGLCARLRVDAAGVLLAVADVSDLWSAGAPTRDLLRVAAQVDAEVQRILQLLVEVARAVQKRAVAPAGIRNGFKRAARAIEAAYAQLPAWIEPVVGGVIPPVSSVPPLPPAPPLDALEEAWADGHPLDAVEALRALPPGLERDVAIAWTRASGGDPPAGLADELLDLAGRADRPALAAALGITAGPCLLWAGEHDRAVVLAREHATAAIARRNGTWLAAAGLLEAEARFAVGDGEGARGVVRDTAWRCWHLGAPAALTLLLRWRPPEEADAA